MNLLKTIIERLNQRVEVANIFDKQFGLCELNANGNEKAWVHYIGNGQAEVVTNFDAKQGTLFWAKRGKVTVVKTDAYKMSGCKQLYVTSFPLTAYAVVRKSHLPCDGDDAQDWLASRIYKLTSGTDSQFKQSLGVINYEVIPSGYINEIKSLTANYEFACVTVDFDVQVITTTEDGCYDICATGDIPLPDFQPCTPCLTEVAVDGVTITGNGTPSDPLVAVGGEGGAIAVEEEGVEVTPVATTLNFTGEGVTASLTSPGVVEVNIPGGSGTPQVNSDWNATSGVAEILNKPTIPVLPATIVEDVTATAPIASSGGANPDISITQADGSTDGYLSSADWNTFDGKFDLPTGTSADYLDGTGAPTPFPTIPPSQVNSDWNASSGVEEILNKPTIPDSTLLVPYTGATADVELGDKDLYAGKVWLFDAPNAVYGSIHLTDNDFHIEDSDGHKMLVIEDGFMQIHLSDTIQSNLFTSNLTATRDHYLPNASGTIALTSDIPSVTPSALTKTDDTNVTLTLGGSPTTALLQGVSITAGWSGTLADSRIASAATWNAKQNAITTGTTLQYLRGDLSLATFPTITSGTVTSVAALTLGTSGTDLGSSVATGTTTPVITLNVPTASAANRGALSAADWSTFNAKQAALVSGTNIKTINGASVLGSGNIATPFELVIAASDETTALTTGTAKITFRMPRAVTLTAVRASLTTAQASGSIFTVDINENGTSILSTKLTIDNTEKTSTTAATPPVISDTALADDAEITIDIDQIGNGSAKGLKVMLIGTYA